MDTYDLEFNNGLTLRDHIRVLFRQKAVVFLVMVSVLAVVVVGLKLRTPVYEARVKLLVSGEKSIAAAYYHDLAETGRSLSPSLTQVEIVQSGPVLERVVKQLHLDARPLDQEKVFASPLKQRLIAYLAARQEAALERYPPDLRAKVLFRQAVESLRRSIKVEPVKDTNIFDISVRDYDPVAAAAIANILSRSYIIFDLEQQLMEFRLKYGEKHPTTLQLQDNINAMVGSLDTARLTDFEALGPASVKIIEQADVPLMPMGPSKTTLLLLAGIFSVCAGLAVAFMSEAMDQTVRSPAEIEKYPNAFYMGSTPGSRYFPGRNGKHKTGVLSRGERFFDALAERVLSLRVGRGIKTLTFLSLQESDEQKQIAVSLAKFMADHFSSKVLLVEANFRSSVVPRGLKAGADDGRFEAPEGKLRWDEAVCRVSDNLAVVPAGQVIASPAAILGSGRLNEEVKEMGRSFDVVFILTPELSACKDGYLVAGQTDGVVLVVSEGRTRRLSVLEVLSRLQGHPEKVGVILHDRSFPIPGFVYGRV